MKIYKDIQGNTFRFSPEGMIPAPVNESLVLNSKQLLREFYSINLNENLIKEAREHPEKPLIVKCLLQRAGEKNQNGRVYDKEVLMREAAKYDENFVKNHSAIGELDHPEKSVVELQNASHIIESMWWAGDDLMGTLRVLSTPKGRILKDLLLDGVRVGMSSRGLGTTTKTNEGFERVNNDFELLAFDCVSNPSVQGAFMETMNESTIPGLAKAIQGYKPMIALENAVKEAKKIAWESYKKSYEYALKSTYKTDEQLMEEFR